jgi:triosephosphate isomerase
LLLGHSEARRLGDTEEIIARKLRLALKYDWRIILCVGEAARDDQGQYLQIIKQQLESALRGVPRKFFDRLVIAYEPVWAIGEAAKQSDSPAGFLEQAIYIRRIISALVGKEAALALPVLYGGSVTAANAAGFLGEGQAAGLLVGRASLVPAEFNKILRLAHDATKNN